MKSLVNEDFVLLALDQLNNDGLLAEGFKQNDRFGGLSRREVIRKVGISSMVALPIVSSIAAPKAAAAQSVCVVPTGICRPMGFDLCARCTGVTVTYSFFPSIDGSCTGSGGTSAYVCGPAFPNGSDFIITSVA